MKARVITAIGFTLIIVAAIILGRPYMLALLGFAMFVSTREMYSALRATGIEPVRWAGYLSCLLVILSGYLSLRAPTELPLSIFALTIGVMAAMVRLVSHGKIAVDSLMATVFPMVYPGVFYMTMIGIATFRNRALFVTAMVMAFFSASVNDVFALFGGMFFGKHKLSPILSPKKTIEGSISGILFSIGFSMLIPSLIRWIFFFDASVQTQIGSLPPLWAFAILGFLCGALSQVGDLTASMVKRHCGIKDFGNLLPGHGGIMDRLDGVLFCGAAIYIFFEIYGLLI